MRREKRGGVRREKRGLWREEERGGSREPLVNMSKETEGRPFPFQNDLKICAELLAKLESYIQHHQD